MRCLFVFKANFGEKLKLTPDIYASASKLHKINSSSKMTTLLNLHFFRLWMSRIFCNVRQRKRYLQKSRFSTTLSCQHWLLTLHVRWQSWRNHRNQFSRFWRTQDKFGVSNCMLLLWILENGFYRLEENKSLRLINRK